MKKQLDPEQDNLDTLTDLDLDAQAEAIYQGLTVFMERLDTKGVDPSIVNAVLLRAFVDRMADLGDRETFEELLEIALEDPWDEHTIH